MQDRGMRVRNIDQVLDQLLVEGIFVRCRPKTSVAVLAAVEVEFEGRCTTGWLEKKVEPISVPL